MLTSGPSPMPGCAQLRGFPVPCYLGLGHLSCALCPSSTSSLEGVASCTHAHTCTHRAHGCKHIHWALHDASQCVLAFWGQLSPLGPWKAVQLRRLLGGGSKGRRMSGKE